MLIDDDGNSYLFTGGGGLMVGKLKDNMVELEVMPGVTNAPQRRGFGGENRMQRIANLPRPGLIEGPFAFKRNGIYYLTYPHAVTNAGFESERLEYSISTNAMGPYTWTGVITDQNESHCWTEHHSLVEYKGSGTCSITTKICPRTSTRTDPSARIICISMTTERSRKSFQLCAALGL